MATASNPASGGSRLVQKLARLPHIALGLAVLSILALIISGLGHQWGWWHFRSGFTIMRYAAYGGIAAAILALIGGVLTRPGSGRRGFPLAVIALVVGGITFGYPYYQLRIVYSVPFIHDITTDTINPPQFVDVVPLRAGVENPPQYDGAEVAQQQLEAYPDLGAVRFDEPPDQVFLAAHDAAQSMGWEMVAASAEEGRIEATDTTLWYGFKDDVVIRVAEEAGGTIVDVRSKSRVGRSDLGVNAKRIRAYIAELHSRMGK